MSEKPEHIGLDSKSPAERDRIDMNHEISGESTGRIQRFLSNDSHSIYGDSEKKKSERHYRSMLEILLAEDAQYAALYSQVTDKLEKAYQATDQALIDTNQRLEDSVRNLQILRDNATELEDGTKVFQSVNDGSIYTEEGKRLNDDTAQNFNVPDGAPSWETYKAEKEVYDAAARQKEEIENYQSNVLDTAKDRMSNEDDPPTMDELDDILKSIENKMPDSVKEIYKSSDTALLSPSVAQEAQGNPNISFPDINTAFDKARHEAPDQLNTTPPQPEFEIPSISPG